MPTSILRTFKAWPQFESKFKALIPKECFLPENENICWEWQGSKHRQGYGRLTWGRIDTYFAHRISYFIFNGDIPYGNVVRHTCDNPACVNPKHLILGNQSENTIDSVIRNRHGNQKLNEECVKVIKWMLKYQYKHGLIAKLASLHHVQYDTIRKIKGDLRWDYVKV